jgi:type II secretory pathway component PulC
VRLLGVIAERDGRGRALLRMPDGTPRLAASGESLGAAGTLAKVGPDGITLRDGSGERRLELRAPPAARPAAPGAVRNASCVPPGYRGAVVRLNAELVAGWITQPQSLHAIAQPTQDGLVVRDDSGLAAMLGLRKGDRVTQANGIPLRAPEDVVIAVLRPLAANQGVRISGVRGNAPHELMIVNAATCP